MLVLIQLRKKGNY